jgi:MFS family permease
MIGPAIAGLKIAGVGTGWVFQLNALSFVAVLGARGVVRVDRPAAARRGAVSSRLVDGLRYVPRQTDPKVILFMLFSDRRFLPEFCDLHLDHDGHGLSHGRRPIWPVDFDHGRRLRDRRADGRRTDQAGLPVLILGAAVFGLGCALAAMTPGYALFGLVLFVVGVAAQTLTTTTNSLVQMSTEPAMRGRVVAILLAITLGGTPLGAPIVGWVAGHFSPRWALGIAATAGMLAAATALAYLARQSNRSSCAGGSAG